MSPLARAFCRGGCKLSQKVATKQILKQAAVVRHMSGESRLHSTDIAFKPAESGWGGGGKYANNFDAIFKKKKEENNKEESAKKTDEE